MRTAGGMVAMAMVVWTLVAGMTGCGTDGGEEGAPPTDTGLVLPLDPGLRWEYAITATGPIVTGSLRLTREEIRLEAVLSGGLIALESVPGEAAMDSAHPDTCSLREPYACSHPALPETAGNLFAPFGDSVISYRDIRDRGIRYRVQTMIGGEPGRERTRMRVFRDSLGWVYDRNGMAGEADSAWSLTKRLITFDGVPIDTTAVSRVLQAL